MDRVGLFEPTTSAIFLKPRISIVQIPPAPLCMLLSGQLQADVLFVRMNGSQHMGLDVKTQANAVSMNVSR